MRLAMLCVTVAAADALQMRVAPRGSNVAPRHTKYANSRRAVPVCAAPVRQAIGTLYLANSVARGILPLDAQPSKDAIAAALVGITSATATGAGPALDAKPWRALYSCARAAKGTEPDTLKALWPARAEYSFAHQPIRRPNGSVADGSCESTVRLLFGLLRLTFAGSYSLGAGGRMTIQFEKLRLGLCRFPALTLSIARGPLRAFINRVRGGKPQRPNVFMWHYADESICVASGTSGRVAVWGAAA
jgi:hypothetical protein